ncbi:MAG TPA: HEAT repeat domain-containing protein [Roseiflexaceae bacterium]|nr:HEAT repeat domain-containing protein [Roseiflexaceae bacterium]
MEDQDSRTEKQPNGASEQPNGASVDSQANGGEDTQVGQVLQGLAKVTRQLPAVPAATARRADARAIQQANRERIAALIMALGDPGNSLHQHAVDDLVAIGEAAVPALNEALSPNRPWLTSYRAAEALGQIGDGRAAGPLLEALRHPNSNVRWSAVRALSVVGDARALLDLRRVARDDRGKTSWGEPVAGAAQSALSQMQSQNMLLRGADLIKTAVACVLMLVALIIAWEVVGNLRAELRQVGHEPVDPGVVAPLVPTAAPAADSRQPLPQDQAEPTALPTALPTLEAAAEITGTVGTTGNVRAFPVQNQTNVIGAITEGDEVVFLSRTPDGQWYRLRLGERHASRSRINNPDGNENGWVRRSLLLQPPEDVPVEQVVLPTAAPANDAEPAPTPTP